MRKWILIIVPLFVWLKATSAQDMVGCTQLLEDAREAYSAGMVELVPDLLLPCLETGLTGVPKQEAYKLVINAYLFDYLPDEADSVMSDFLVDFPDYQSTPDDDVEFAQLLRTLKQRRADERAAAIAAEADRARQREQERLAIEQRRLEEKARQRQSRPSRRSSSSSIGAFLGSSVSFPQIVEPYSTGNPLEDGGSYGMAIPGLGVGMVFNLPVSRIMEVSFELMYNRTRFNYKAAPLSFAEYEYDEFQNRMGLPLSMLFVLNPDSRTSLYMRAGIIGDYLLSASASGSRSITGTGSSSQGEVVTEKVSITNSRARFNLFGMAGMGVRIPMNKATAFIETRFTSGIFMMNMEENRYDTNQDLIWMINHVDSDFRLHQLNLCAGIAWYL